MNKLQPSPLFSTRAAPLTEPIGPRGTAPVNLNEVKFFRTWLVFDSCDSDWAPRPAQRRANWNLIGGVALMALVSAGGWAGIALLIARLWR